MQAIQTLVRKLSASRWFPILLGIGGVLFYIWGAFDTAHGKTSFLDEGMYLYKGLLFTGGKYVLYQPYGPWASHMPLSYLIPGYVERWFGAGLATGRYFMICLAVLSLAGLWVLAARWGGAWWATAAVWAMALNPAEIKLFTLALPQGLLAVFFIWALALIVGIRRPLWQIILGSILTAVMALIRENMTFVLPVVIAYVFWQHGRKFGLAALLGGLAVVAIGYALYWPGVLSPWASWLPKVLTPFLDPWRIPAAAKGTLLPYYEPINAFTVFLYFWLTIRQHFVALMGAIAVWVLWPRRPGKRLTGRVRAAIFLSVLMAMLWILHLAATYIGEVCVSCILLYAGYFDFLGLILVPVAFRLLQKKVSTGRAVAILALILVTMLSVASTTYEDISGDLANRIIPFIRDSYVWGVWRRFFQAASPLMLFRGLVLVCAGLLIILLAAGLFVWSRRLFRDRSTWMQRMPVTALHGFVIAGLVLSPTWLLGRGNDFFDCGGSDVLKSYAEAGDYLHSVIPAGSKVYWEGRITAIFLYLPQVEIYPPQLNQVHNFFIGGDGPTLLRLNRWNDVLAKQWLADADYVLLEKGEAYDWEEQIVKSGGYTALAPSPKVEKCRWQSIIEVYERARP